MGTNKPEVLFRLKCLLGIGAFPKIERPRIIWVGLEDKQGKIKQLAKDLENKLQKIKIKKEDHSFKAHVTIARVRSLKNSKSFIEEIKLIPPPSNLSQEVNSITLIKSTLTPKGPDYETIDTINLC